MPMNPCSAFPLTEARMKSTVDFYKLRGKQFKAPTMGSNPRKQFLGNDTRIDGIFNANNPN